MKIHLLILISIVGFGIVDAIHPTKNIIHVKEGPQSGGYWRSKVEWKAQWVKSWVPKTTYVPLWKKVWSPVDIKEWVPLPHPPPGWTQH